MIERERFGSIWNGLALIIMFSGIFLGFKPAGFSALGVAIFMWVIGNTVEDMIYGPETKSSESEDEKETFSGMCSSCGEVNGPGSEFCMQCGASLIVSSSNSPTTKLK